MTRSFRVSLLLLLLAGTAHAQTPAHTITMAVDGRDEIRLFNGNLRVHHYSFAAPTSITVDGTNYPLSFDGSGNGNLITGVNIFGDYWVRKTAGRDIGAGFWRESGTTLGIEDNQLGGDTYTMEFHNAPLANTTDWMRVLGNGSTVGLMGFPNVPGYAPRPSGTTTTFSITVDGSDELMFVNGNLVIRHLVWNNPTDLFINGVEQQLNFTNGLSDPIPITLPDALQFTQTGGRVNIFPEQTPVGLVLAIGDEINGTSTYTFTISAVPEPSTWGLLGLLAAAGGVGAKVRQLRRRRQ